MTISTVVGADTNVESEYKQKQSEIMYLIRFIYPTAEGA